MSDQFEFSSWETPEEAGVSSAGLLRFLEEAALRQDTVQYHSLVLLRHGKAAAMIASAKFRITDFDVLDAVMWHTTGRAGLTRLGQVLFVADYTEAGRTGEHFDRVRTVLARFGLMAAVAEECRLTILYRASKHLIPMDEQETFAAPADINMYTVETLNWALGELARERGQHGNGGNS